MKKQTNRENVEQKNETKNANGNSESLIWEKRISPFFLINFRSFLFVFFFSFLSVHFSFVILLYGMLFPLPRKKIGDLSFVSNFNIL
jgi:hypothetical protein